MALLGYYTVYARNKMQAHLLGKTAYTQPDPWYYAIHLATTLGVGVSAGGSTITVPAPIATGANLIVAPAYSGTGDANAEQHVALSVSGSGPYVVTLVDTLAHNHSSGVYVAFDPGLDCAQLLEPVGNAYDRSVATLANNTTNFPAPSGGEVDSNAQISWPDPSATWTLATHIVALDDPTAGNAWIVGVLGSFLILNTLTPAPKIAAGNLFAQANNPF